jgi:hypothetical protein
MNATKSPVAFSMARFRARGIFWRGSTQYLIGILALAAIAATTSLADSKWSLSATTIEYVKRPSVS